MRLLHQPGLLGEILDDPMLLPDLRDEPFGRRPLLKNSEARELRGDRWIARHLLDRRHQRPGDLGRHPGRREEAEPDAEQVLPMAELGERGAYYTSHQRAISRSS